MFTQCRNILAVIGAATAPSLLNSCSEEDTASEITAPNLESTVLPSPVIEETEITVSDEATVENTTAIQDPEVKESDSFLTSTFQRFQPDLKQWRDDALETCSTSIKKVQSGTEEIGSATVDWAKITYDTSNTKARDLIERSKVFYEDSSTQSAALAKEWSDKASAWSTEISKKAVDEWAPATKEFAAESLEEARERATKIGPQIQLTTEQSAEALRESIIDASQLMEKWGIDADTQRKMMRMGIAVIPVLGALKKYDDARDEYHLGVTNKDLAQMEAAKVKCLVAFSEFGFDVGLIGVAEGAAGIQAALSSMSLIKTASSVTELDVEALTPLMQKALAIKEIDQAVIHSLERSEPGKILNVIFPEIVNKD